MSGIKTLDAVVVVRVTERTRKALIRRARREGKRPSEAVRELCETYAHPIKSNGD